MNKFERLQELERLRGECLSLEEKAQLSQAMERAREGRFIPLGAFGEDVSPKEYFANEHDCLREKTRDVYFSVADLYARKALIEAQRKVESRIRQSLEEEIIEENKEVAVASSKTQRLPWGKAALLGVGAVAVGYWVFGMVGAIAGAVASFFLGQGVIADARNEANAELAQTSDNFEQAKKRGRSNHSCLSFLAIVKKCQVIVTIILMMSRPMKIFFALPIAANLAFKRGFAKMLAKPD